MQHDLSRFLTVQDAENFLPGETVWEGALRELRGGRKESHWMWFIFPQMKGLGHSFMAEHYGISGLAEAQAYAAHPVLGVRLRELAAALLALPEQSPEAVFGWTDAMKLRSSMTLFAHAAPEEPLFRQVLEKYYGGAEDDRTLTLLQEGK